MKLNAISVVKCKAFSSKTITLPTHMKEDLAVRALNRESIVHLLQLHKDSPKETQLSPSHHLCPIYDY